MGYRSDVRISTTKKGYETLKNYCSGLNLEYDLMDGGKHYIDRQDDCYIAFGWESIKWYESYPEVQAIMIGLDSLEENGIPYIYARIGESIDDAEERYVGDVDKLFYLMVCREFVYD